MLERVFDLLLAVLWSPLCLLYSLCNVASDCTSMRNVSSAFKRYVVFKGGLLLKNKNKNIHLYFIATKYLWNNAIVEYIDNWARSYSIVIIYQKRQK